MRRSVFPSLACAILLGVFLSPARAETWAPPDPEPAQRDWIMLASGEWLWGEITLFRDEHLYFDSEKLDELDLDWDDIASIRSARVLTYSFTDERVATGTAVLQDGIIRIQTSAGDEEFPRTELIKVIEGDQSEISFWSLRASLGMTVRAGNTDQTDLNTFLRLRRESTRSRVDLDYNGNYSRVDDSQTVNNQRAGASWNIIIGRGFFVSPVLAELYRDEFQNIDIRSTLGSGLGLWIVRDSDLEWNVQLGGSYRGTRYISVEPGQSDTDRTGSIVPATALEWDITGDIELDFGYDAQIGLPDPKDTTHHLQTLLSIDVIGDVIDIVSNFTWDRIETPKADADGIVPERNDIRLALGVGIDL